MVKMTTEEFVEKWGRRLKGATEDMRRGADRVSVAPSAQAVAKKDKMKARLNESIDNGTWAKQLGGYGLDSWKKDFKEVGVARISSGVDKAQPKMEKFAAYLIPAVTEGQTKVDKMPDLTLDDNINRMTTFVRHMSGKKYKKP